MKIIKITKILVLDLWAKMLSTSQIGGNDKVYFCYADKH